MFMKTKTVVRNNRIIWHQQSPVRSLLAFVLTLASFGCDPIHYVDVSGQLAQSMNGDCILHAIRGAEGIVNVSVNHPAPRKVWSLFDGIHEEVGPTQYIAESRNRAGDPRPVGFIVQRENEGGIVDFRSYTAWMGPEPPTEVREQAQVFNAYLARHVSEFCHAKYVEEKGLKCKPDSKSCEDALLGLGPN
jgi:hypothetical protein